MAAGGPEPEREQERERSLRESAAFETLGQASEDPLPSLSQAIVGAALETTTDGLLVADAQGRISAFNSAFAAMWRLAAETLAGADLRLVAEVVGRALVSPEADPGRLAEIRATAPPETFDELVTRDGRTIERSSRRLLLGDRDAGRVWRFRDVTGRRRAEEAVGDEARLLELLNRTGKAIASRLDTRALVQEVTDAARELTDAAYCAFFYSVSEPGRESFLLYTLSGASRDDFEKFGLPRNTPIFEATFRGRGAVRSDDVTRDPRYGRLAPHHGMPRGHLPVRSYLAAPVISRSGAVIGGIFCGHPDLGVFSERSERLLLGIASQAGIAIDNARLYDDVRKLAEEREALLDAERAARSEAQRVSRMKDEFLATVSHELRTPLNAILGWSQLLTSAGAGGDDLKHGLETIARNARAQSQLIEDLLDMSRIVTGLVRLDVRQIDLATVVGEAVHAARPSAESKGIRLRQVVDPSVGPVSGDPSRLQQVVWNLVSNAIKFTPRDGDVDVMLRRADFRAEIVVTDTGIGIKPDFLPHLFERFRQGDPSTTRVHGGLGLGLSIVKHLVELHGGTVSAASAGVGRGASFTVSLPLAAARAAARSAPVSSAPLDWESVDLSGVRVLVVEDEADARELIRRVLSDRGAEVVVAASAADAMRSLAERRPDVLVSDIGMPETDGYQFIRQLRRRSEAEGGKVPAIALTAFARSVDRTRALMAGYELHVAKPIEPQELVATVASLAGRTSRDSGSSQGPPS